MFFKTPRQLNKNEESDEYLTINYFKMENYNGDYKAAYNAFKFIIENKGKFSTERIIGKALYHIYLLIKEEKINLNSEIKVELGKLVNKNLTNQDDGVIRQELLEQAAANKYEEAENLLEYNRKLFDPTHDMQ